MCNKLSDKHFFNCGWDHFWCDPKNFKSYCVRELINGPFSSPKIVYSIPYVTFSKLYGTAIRLSEGIPDCWAECLTHKLRFFREYLQKNDLMHKECVDITPQLRKKYRLYIGQGIPNPWVSYSCIDKSEIVPQRVLSVENTEKYLCHLSHCKHLKKNLKKEVCIWCKKKYLFECPDEFDTDSNFCLHKNCQDRNTKTTDCSKNCSCVEFLENAILKEQKKKSQGGSSESSGSSSNNSGLEAEDKDQKENKRTQSCERIRIQKAYDHIVSGKSADERRCKSNNRNNVLSKKQPNICFCPYIKSFCLNKIPQRNCTVKNFLAPTSSSKLIQAEMQPIKISKTSQTENAESRKQIKCMCSNNKCVQYSAYQCISPWLKCCSAAQSVSCLCFPLGYSQNPAFICPCFMSNNYLHRNFNKHKSKNKKERFKRKQHKEKETDHESNIKFKINQNSPKLDEKYDFKEQKLPKMHYNDLRSKYPKTFDHLKYLTDEKLKYFFQQDEISASVINKINIPPSDSGSRLISFCNNGTSLYNLRPEKFELKKLKTYSNPRHFESSFVDSKMSFQENNLLNYNTKRFNFCDQSTMTITPKNNSINRGKFFKERVESDESRNYDLGSNRVFSTKAMRKRRRLLTNRKRRKKLAASGKISFLEYQALLKKLLKEPALINKQVQAIKSDSDCFNLKKGIFPVLDISNESSNLKFINNTSEHTTADTWKKIDKEIGSQNLKLDGNETHEGTLKRPLHSDSQFDGVFEKISCNSGSSWSSVALKNIINDLLMDKKCQEQK